MRNFLVFILFCCGGCFTAVFGQPCDSYTCDSLMVRAILDSNGLTTVKVKDVTLTSANGRIDVLVFFKMPLKTIPGQVQWLTELVSLNVQNAPLTSISQGVTTLPKLATISLDSTRMCNASSNLTSWGTSHNFKNTNPECSSPVITLIGASTIYVQRGEPFVDPGATASQKTDGDLTDRITVTGVGSTETVNNFIVTYSVYDLAGGSNRITRTVKVVEKSSIKPTITMLGKNPDTVFWKKPYTDPSATASDVVDGNLTGKIENVSTVDISVPGKYAITYRVTNSFGNTVEAQRVVWVIDPSPRIFLKGLSQIILYQGNTYVEPEGSYATGYFTPGPIEIDTGSLNVHVPGDYVIVYKVTDTEGYTAQKSRLVTIKMDSLAPVITLAGRNPLPWKKGVPYVDPGVTATDPENGDLTTKIEKLTSIDVSVTGVQPLKFRVSDPAGNVAEVTRNVEVVVDTVPPRITLSGDSLFTMFQGTAYFEPGYAAYDSLWKLDYTGSVTVSGTIDRGKPGEYTLIYSVQDSAGNKAVKTRVVKVIADVHPPRLELKNDTVVYVMINGSFSEPGFNAYDEECRCDFTSAVAVSGTIDSSKAGDYVRTYSVKDSVGNTATASRRVVVTERPVIGTIQFNQIGYLPLAPKVLTFINRTATSYRVLKMPDSSVVQEGNFPLADSIRKYVDISNINEPGTYIINPEGLGFSPPVKIGNDVYDEILKAALKSYYYQRCSYELTDEYAGIWCRKAGHPDTALPVFGSTGTTRNVPGGWYDAGDYGKYIVNAGVSVGTLLNLYEAYPKRIGDYTGIPESKNDISDLLDEVRYELEWFLTMQDTDGGVFFKVGPLKWPLFIMPSEDIGQRYVIGKSTGSTLNFAAVMAMAARVWKEHDRSFADTCLSRSLRAYKWASSNNAVSAPGETGGTGDYYDSGYEDEFFWARTELYLTTGNKDYKAKFNQYAWGTEYAHWQRVYCPAFYSLLTKTTSSEDSGLIDTVIMVMKKNADQMIAKAAKLVYNAPIEEAWGSNGDIGNKAVMLLNLYKVTDDKKYLTAAYGILDYLLGKNSVGYSFVTGFGNRSPQHPHHRVSGSDGIPAPVPGFVVGGPNSGYSDFQSLYNQNEVAINWNAPLVYLLAYFCKDQDVSTPVLGNSSSLGRIAHQMVGIRYNSGRIRLAFAPGENEKASISIYSLSGRTVLKLDGISIPREQHTIEVDLRHKLTSGIYMVDIRYGGVRKTVTINHCFH